MLIPAESLPYFENMIYLPMVLTVFEQDRIKFVQLDVKLPRPYLNIIDGAIKAAQNDLKETKLYMRQHNYKIVRDSVDSTVTVYTFFFKGYEHQRRYLNVRLRNRCEELIEMYLAKA